MLIKSLVRSVLISFLCCIYFASSVFADDIHVAVERGSVEKVKAALKANPDAVNSPRKDGMLPLHIAAEMGNAEIVDLLISAGADVHASNRYRSTSLGLAIWKRQPEAVKRLVKAGALKHSDSNSSPLHWAANSDPEIVRILIAAGIDVDVRDFSENTPLHRAAQAKRPDIVEILIKAEANVEAINNKNFTPLMTLGTRMQGDKDAGALVEIARMLLRAGANPEFTDDDDWTILHYAVWFDVADLVKALIEEGLDVEAEDKGGNTPLDLARNQGFKRIITILEVAESS